MHVFWWRSIATPYGCCTFHHWYMPCWPLASWRKIMIVYSFFIRRKRCNMIRSLYNYWNKHNFFQNRCCFDSCITKNDFGYYYPWKLLHIGYHNIAIDVVGMSINIVMVWVWVYVNTNGWDKGKNKNYPYPCLVCPQYP